jgi:hypothetical protein
MSATLTAGFDLLCDELLGQLSNADDFYAQSQDPTTLNDTAPDEAHEGEKTYYRRTMSSEHHGIVETEGPDSSFA